MLDACCNFRRAVILHPEAVGPLYLQDQQRLPIIILSLFWSQLWWILWLAEQPPPPSSSPPPSSLSSSPPSSSSSPPSSSSSLLTFHHCLKWDSKSEADGLCQKRQEPVPRFLLFSTMQVAGFVHIHICILQNKYEITYFEAGWWQICKCICILHNKWEIIYFVAVWWQICMLQVRAWEIICGATCWKSGIPDSMLHWFVEILR